MSNFFNDNHISRARANSAGSVPDVPYNTPETQSVVNDNASVVSSDMNIVTEGVSRDEKILFRTKSSINGEKVDGSLDLTSPLKNMTRTEHHPLRFECTPLTLTVGDSMQRRSNLQSTSPKPDRGESCNTYVDLQ